MDDFMLQDPHFQDDWPAECFDKYERVHILGKGSFGMVWMSHRLQPAEDEFDDEFVAIKAIMIKNEKSKVYAEREIRILQELRHPNVIRLIRAYPIYNDTRAVVMQLAQGPNLNQLVVKRGALGLPLCRMVARQLIAAVGYVHGRGVIHRDVKPSNCILALVNVTGPMRDAVYDWFDDGAIWSSGEDGVAAVKSHKWKLMLVDFGFARALEKEEIDGQAKKMRNSIAFESVPAPQHSESNADNGSQEEPPSPKPYVPGSIYATIPEDESAKNGEDDSIEADMQTLESMVAQAAEGMRKSHFEATNPDEEAVMGASPDSRRKRHSGVSMPLPEKVRSKGRRISTARRHVRSMSALGTKAYAAPEIRRQLRKKNEADFEKANAAMTECVADYGMIVDAYSVGWTLRVAFTGVPPNYTISEYMHEYDNVVLEDAEGVDDPVEKAASWCCCAPVDVPIVRIRDPSMLPPAATLLITRMTEKQPEDRMTVREAQNNPWIAPGEDEKDDEWVLPHGDVPSKHGDPVVPLKCAAELSQLTVKYHMA